MLRLVSRVAVFSLLLLVVAGSLAQTAPDDTAPPADASSREPKRAQSVENIYQQEGVLFTNKFTFELGLTYARFDRRQLTLSGFLALDAIFLGTISVDQVKSDIFTIDSTARWGITDRLQVDVNLPAVFRSSNFISAGAGGSSTAPSEARSKASDIGDASVGVYYQLSPETTTSPDLVVNFRLKAPTGVEPYGIKVFQPDPANSNLQIPRSLPTGSGLWAFSFGASVLRTLDPAITFANLQYTHNRAGSFDDISTVEGTVQPGEVDLGNSIQWGFGIAFALNEISSLSFSFSDLIVQAARTRAAGAEWTKIVGSDANAATFNIGFTRSFNPVSSMIASLGIGLTPDAPDFSFSLRFPSAW